MEGCWRLSPWGKFVSSSRMRCSHCQRPGMAVESRLNGLDLVECGSA
jgi:hypothetical protein